MKVIATKQGYFGKLREVNETFDVPDGEKASWFTSVEKEEGKPQSKRAQKQDSDSLV